MWYPVDHMRLFRFNITSNILFPLNIWDFNHFIMFNFVLMWCKIELVAIVLWCYTPGRFLQSSYYAKAPLGTLDWQMSNFLIGGHFYEVQMLQTSTATTPWSDAVALRNVTFVTNYFVTTIYIHNEIDKQEFLSFSNHAILIHNNLSSIYVMQCTRITLERKVCLHMTLLKWIYNSPLKANIDTLNIVNQTNPPALSLFSFIRGAGKMSSKFTFVIS